MPISFSPQSEIVQKLIHAATSLSLDEKQKQLWHRIVSSLHQQEQETIEQVLASNPLLTEKFITNTLAKYDYLKANDSDGIERILKEDAGMLETH